MAIAVEETVTGSTTSSSSYTLTSWTPGANELVIVSVSTRGTDTTDSVTGNGLTFVEILEVTDDQNQMTHSVWRAMGASPSTGQITVNISSSTLPSIALASRFSGVDTSGTNGSGAVEASASANQGGTDNDDFKLDITTLTADAWALGSGNHRNKTLTLDDETEIDINNFAGSGGDQLSCSQFYQVVASPTTVTLGTDNDLSAIGEWVLIGLSIKPAETTLNVSVSESVGVAESVGLNLPDYVFSPNVSESVGVAESVNASLPGSETITFTNLGNSVGLGDEGAANPDINDGGNTTSYSNTSWTPPTSGLIILVFYSRTGGGYQESSSVSGNSLTWTKIKVATSGIYGAELYAADASGATTGATTITFPSAQAFFTGGFFQATGVDLSGGVAAAFVQSPTGSGTDTSGSITLAAAGDSANRPISIFGHAANEDSTNRTNWTELDDMRGGVTAAPDRGMISQGRSDAFEVTASASWPTSSDWVGIAAELKADVTGPLSVSVSDSVGVAEAVAVEAPRAVNVSDSAAAAEAVGLNIPDYVFSPAVSDSIGVAEAVAVSTTTTCPVSVSDSVSVAESVGLNIPDYVFSPNVSDSISLAEAVQVALEDTLSLTVSEAVSLADSPAVSLGGLLPPLDEGVLAGGLLPLSGGLN